MLIWEPVHERPCVALSVGLACSRTTQYAPRARPPSALHLAIPEQAPPPQYSDTLVAPFTRTQGPSNLLIHLIHRLSHLGCVLWRRIGTLLLTATVLSASIAAAEDQATPIPPPEPAEQTEPVVPSAATDQPPPVQPIPPSEPSPSVEPPAAVDQPTADQPSRSQEHTSE